MMSAESENPDASSHTLKVLIPLVRIKSCASHFLFYADDFIVPAVPPHSAAGQAPLPFLSSPSLNAARDMIGRNG